MDAVSELGHMPVSAAKVIAPNDITPRPPAEISSPSLCTAKAQSQTRPVGLSPSAPAPPVAQHVQPVACSAFDVRSGETNDSCGSEEQAAPAAGTHGRGLHQEQSGADLASAQQQPLLKRRRVGRGSTDPAMTSDERRRLRTLKNRESAMRSLQKKAEYASQLETDERTQREIVATQRDALQQLVQSAIEARAELVQTFDHSDLVGVVDDCISRCRGAIVDSVAEPTDLG
jgi:hypothetical protein